MRKDPSERYASVADLAQDIRHYLAGEPVQARPHRFSYPATRFLARHQMSLLAAMVLIGLGVSLVLWQRQTESFNTSAEQAPQSAIPERSIAVLPFDDLAGEDNNSSFAAGVQDDILTNLAKAEDLKVISRTGVAPYRKGPRNIKEIGRALGVAYVLEGSVRKLGDRVRVNAQLIDTRSDAQVWAEQYDRKIDDLFALQTELAQTIVIQLKGKLSASELAAIKNRPTKDAEAYDLYLQAKGAFMQYQHRKTVELLDQAVARDPDFALAYCLLTDANLYIYRFGGDQSPERLEKARQAAETALRVAPDLPEAHLAKANYYYNGLRDYEKALAELAAAPPAPNARAEFYNLTALTERRLGRWKEALANGQKALELDPYDPFITVAVIQSYISLRRYAEAEKLSHRAKKLFNTDDAPFWYYEAESVLAQGDPARARTLLQSAPPDARDRNYQLARIAFFERDFDRALSELKASPEPAEQPTMRGLNELFRGTIARAQGDATKAEQSFNNAREIFEKVLPKHPNHSITLINLALAYAGLGRKADALRSSQQAVQLQPSWRDAAEGPGMAALHAQVQAWVGEKETGINELASIAKQPAGPTYGELKLDPAWDDLRGDPRFAEIVAETAKPLVLE